MRDDPARTPDDGRRSGDHRPPAGEPPDWVAAACQGPIATARRARWGFRHETWIANGADGGTTVVQRRSDGSDPTNPAARELRELVRSAGLVVPEPTRVEWVGAGVVVILPFIAGVAAAERLASGPGAAMVGGRCGEIAARFASIDPAAAPIPRAMATGDGLRATMSGLVDSHAATLSAHVRDRVSAAVDRAATELDAGSPRPVHGDLVPVNVLLRGDRVAAILDLDRMRVAHPDYDAAWFTWVVSSYHPDVADVAYRAFARAAGMAVKSIAELSWMWPIQLLERLAEAADRTERSAWAARLADTAKSG